MSWQIIETRLIPQLFTHLNSHGIGGSSKWGAVSNVRATNGRQIRAICLHREARPNKSDKFANLRGAGVDLYAGCGEEVTPPLSSPNLQEG